MRHLKNGLFLCEELSDLPNFNGATEFFGDVETKRVFDHPDLGGLYPWKGDKICGIGISFDNDPKVFYLPVRHTSPGSQNLPIEPVMRYLQDLLNHVRDWINHNVKFDAMFLAVGDGVMFKNRLVDTLTLCKMHYSDRMKFGLKDICADWIGYDISSSARVGAYLDSIKSKSYADVPPDILGLYCCDDVRMCRMLYRYLQEKRPEPLASLWETEIAFTPLLFDMEYDGMKVDIIETKKEKIRALHRMITAGDTIQRLIGCEFTNSNDCIYDIFVNQLGLPVLSTIIAKDDEGQKYDTGRPTFDHDALELYRAHPLVVINPDRQAIVGAVLDYRDASQYNSLFLDTFLELNVEGIVHPNYNQCVRTGRLSCSKPNSQQQNTRSKKLIKPRPGNGFISNDYSQIEYRLIVHYVNDELAVKAYNENPDTDFHQWVADMLQIIRKDAKTLNFGMAYGASKKTVTHNLTTNPEIIKLVSEKVKDIEDPIVREQAFLELCKEHAERCYDQYHERFPGIKRTAYRASRICRERGFVFNAYGRRRHLPDRASHKAFNSIVQGCAADIMKERMVVIAPRYNSVTRGYGLKLAANVHDELLEECPLDRLYDPEVHNHICNILEHPRIQFRVPIRCGLGVSPNNWSEAANDKLALRDTEGHFIAGKMK